MTTAFIRNDYTNLTPPHLKHCRITSTNSPHHYNVFVVVSCCWQWQNTSCSGSKGWIITWDQWWLWKGTKATQAWTLTTGFEDHLSMKGGGPVDGIISTLSSFWSEVQGQVVLLIMMTLLVRVHNVLQPLFTSICNNKGALKWLLPLKTGLQLHHCKESDADLLFTFHQWSDDNIKHTSQWVWGHQDSLKQKADLTDVETIKVNMGHLAAVSYELNHKLTIWITQEVLPAEIIVVFINGAKITTHLKKTISHDCHSPLMEIYIAKKHNLNEYNMDQLNWKGIKSFMTKKKMNQ